MSPLKEIQNPLCKLSKGGTLTGQKQDVSSSSPMTRDTHLGEIHIWATFSMKKKKRAPQWCIGAECVAVDRKLSCARGKVGVVLPDIVITLHFVLSAMQFQAPRGQKSDLSVDHQV
jgi:hypothetical protein